MELQDYERIRRELSPVKAVLLFIFCPTAFKRLAVSHDCALNVTNSQDARKQFLEGKYIPDFEHTTQLVEMRTSHLRDSLRGAARTVVSAALIFAVVGFVLNKVFGQCPSWVSALLQMLGAAVLLWATLWELGWSIRSFSGETLAERVHRWLFHTMYASGSAFFFLAYSWSTRW